MWEAMVRAGAVALACLGLAAGCSSGKSTSSASGGYCEKQPAGDSYNDKLGCDQRCPGDKGCAKSSDPTFYAGAAIEDITPKVDYVVAWAPGRENENSFNPQLGDKCVEKATCDLSNPASCPAVDPTQCTWMAGFGIGRPAEGVADQTNVRCIVMKQGNTKLGMCSVDAIGWFYNEVQRTRDLIQQKYPDLDLDYLAVAAEHDHETQDVMGQWGPVDGQSGVKKDYNAMIREKTAAALDKADKALEPVHLEFGASTVDGHIKETDPAGNKTAAFVSDVRDPVVLDNQLRTIRFVSTKDSSTVATMINWCSHPEFSDDKNMMITADYVHTLREGVEKGLDIKDSSGKQIYKADGVGGIAVFFNGALGGQVGPGEVQHVDWEGNPVPEGIQRAYNDGQLLAAYALESLHKGVDARETAALGFRSREIYLTVKNAAFHIAIAQQLFDRDGELYDKTVPLGEGNEPQIRSQIFVLDVGPAELVSVPGELDAELLLATRDGTTSLDKPYPFTPEPYHVLNDPQHNPQCGQDGHSRCDDGPPDISRMDRSKVIDLARDPDAKYRWVIGLGQDELGYVVPEYDYKLDPQDPYFSEASPGDHYEETNSVGPNVQHDTVDPILQLLRSPPVIQREPL